MRPSSARNFQPTENATPADQPLDDHREPRRRAARGVRRVRGLGPGRGRRQADLLRALRAAAPRPGGRRHRRLRRPAHRGLQGPRPGQPGLRRAGAVLAEGPPGRRALPLLHHRLHHLGERPADLPHHRGRQRHRARPQRQPGEHRGAARRGAHGSRRRHRGRPAATAAVQSTTDSDLVTELLAATAADTGVEEAALRLLPRLRGAFSLVFADEQTLYAARDQHGVRPLVLGRLERGWVVASETAALDIIGATMVREVEPGELIAIDAAGMRSSRFAAPEPKGCVFEYVYLARPDTAISGRSVHAARVEIGRRLAAGAPGRGRPGHPDAGVRHPGRDRLRPGLRHPLRPGPGQELLRRAHLHPAVADHPAARHPAQAQPAARRHPGQAAGRGGRLDRARQHPARAGPDAARGRRGGGARADRLAAGALAVLLRHRLRHPGRAGGRRRWTPRACAARSAPTRWATSRWRA